MKYLKNYLLFLEADENIGTDDIKSVDADTTSKSNTESTSLQDTYKLLKEFGEMKTKMENIFKDNLNKLLKLKTTDDQSTQRKKLDVELDAALFTKIYNSKKENQNTLLKEYETVLRMERKKDAYQDEIKKAEDEVKSTNDYIYQLNRELKGASAKRKPQIVSSIKKNQETLKELNNSILSNNKLLSQDTIKWKKAQDDFNKKVKTDQEKNRNLMSKV